MRFSQRIGKSPAAKLVQRESMDDDLRNSLWSLLTLIYWASYCPPGNPIYGRTDYVQGSNLQQLIVSMWLYFFKKPIDTIDEYWRECLDCLRNYFFNAPWYSVFDFVEFVLDYGPETKQKWFVEACNTSLERENSAYRFVNGKVTEITSQQEIQAVEDAISSSTPFAGVSTHLVTALSLLSDRTHPDFRNSIKESVSAVESLAKQISGEPTATLGIVLNKLEESRSLHPALKKAFSSLYGYTNDSHGIRHALMDETTLTKADARFMLVCCSAFVNYAIETLASK